MNTLKIVTTVFLILTMMLFFGYGLHEKKEEDKKMAWIVAGTFSSIMLMALACIWL